MLFAARRINWAHKVHKAPCLRRSFRCSRVCTESMHLQTWVRQWRKEATLLIPGIQPGDGTLSVLKSACLQKDQSSLRMCPGASNHRCSLLKSRQNAVIATDVSRCCISVAERSQTIELKHQRDDGHLLDHLAGDCYLANKLLQQSTPPPGQKQTSHIYGSRLPAGGTLEDDSFATGKEGVQLHELHPMSGNEISNLCVWLVTTFLRRHNKGGLGLCCHFLQWIE